MEPLISIIVPVYKVENYLHQCVDSIINQTYQNLEIILVDDGSPDNCGNICDKYAAQDRRVKVVHKKNGGIATARNHALKMAQGEYIAFVDSDDWIDLNLYSTVMRSAPFEMALFGCTYVNEHSKSKIICTPKTEKNSLIWSIDTSEIENLFHSSLFGYACNKVYHRTVIGDTVFSHIKLREDLLFNLSVCSNLNRINIIHTAGYFYNQREDSALHSQYCDVVPDILFVAQKMTTIHPQLPARKNTLLADHLIKNYLCDALRKFVFLNPLLQKNDILKELRHLFSDKNIRTALIVKLDDGVLFLLLSLCYKLRSPVLFYFLARILWKL